MAEEKFTRCPGCRTIFRVTPQQLSMRGGQVRCGHCHTVFNGVAAMLSPGSYGHGGAWGTLAWIDPVKGVAYVLMVQRSNFPNSDASDVRRDFQQAAANALAKQ